MKEADALRYLSLAEEAVERLDEPGGSLWADR